MVQARWAWNKGTSVKEAPASWTREGHHPASALKDSPSVGWGSGCLAAHLEHGPSLPFCQLQFHLPTLDQKCLDLGIAGKDAQVIVKC